MSMQQFNVMACLRNHEIKLCVERLIRLSKQNSRADVALLNNADIQLKETSTHQSGYAEFVQH